jgi:hypothetical protein
MSYNSVVAETGSGGQFEGWAVASAKQFGTMWDDITGESAGITGPFQYSIAERGTQIDEVITLFGDTFGYGYLSERGSSYCDLYPTKCPDGDLRQSRGFLLDRTPSTNGDYEQYLGEISDLDSYDSKPDLISTRAHSSADTTSVTTPVRI